MSVRPTFDRARDEGRAALVGYLPAGFPDVEGGIEQAVRPPEVVRAAYTFAAEHPEVLSYAPCYCGCEHAGHRGNDDCFVMSRAPNGDVTEWEPHGMT